MSSIGSLSSNSPLIQALVASARLQQQSSPLSLIGSSSSTADSTSNFFTDVASFSDPSVRAASANPQLQDILSAALLQQSASSFAQAADQLNPDTSPAQVIAHNPQIQTLVALNQLSQKNSNLFLLSGATSSSNSLSSGFFPFISLLSLAFNNPAPTGQTLDTTA